MDMRRCVCNGRWNRCTNARYRCDGRQFCSALPVDSRQFHSALPVSDQNVHAFFMIESATEKLPPRSSKLSPVQLHWTHFPSDKKNLRMLTCSNLLSDSYYFYNACSYVASYPQLKLYTKILTEALVSPSPHAFVMATYTAKEIECILGLGCLHTLADTI